jgi:nucleoside-diphosphate-sugar epimerase
LSDEFLLPTLVPSQHHSPNTIPFHLSNEAPMNTPEPRPTLPTVHGSTAAASAPHHPATPKEAPTVLILGAAGRFGAAATQAYAEAGWRVLAQARRPLPGLPASAQAVAVDLADTAALAAAARGAGTVVYAVNPLYTRWPTDLLPLARLGMDVAERLGATFLLPGNVYNYGADLPARLREDTPQRAATRKGRLRIELENELAQRAQQGRLRSTVLRAGDFYGCAAGTWLDLAIVKSLRQGKLVYPGPLDRPHAWAYLPDLARAAVALSLREQAGARTPTFTTRHFAGHSPTGAELLAALGRAADALGLQPAAGFRHAGLPWGFIRIAGLVVPMMRELAEMAYLWERPHTLDGSALAHAIGTQPATPLDAALRHTLVAMGFATAPGLAPV